MSPGENTVKGKERDDGKRRRAFNSAWAESPVSVLSSAKPVWDGHSCPSLLTLILTYVVILRKRSRTRSGRLRRRNYATSPVQTT